MEKKCKKGEHVILTDNCCQIFLGLVKSVNYGLGRIVLSDIVQLPENKAITGYRNFDKNEIIDIKKYEADKYEDIVAVDATEKKPPEGQEIPILKSEVNGVCEVNEIPEIHEMNGKNELKDIKKLQCEYCFIVDYGASFHSAIASIKSCKRIGLYAKDTAKGRCGRASVVAIATPSKVFIFDFQALGDEILHRELKDILESSAMTKVVHDCRLLSDCLKHKHLISLEGIRDTEAEDIMLVFQERRMIRRHARPLEYLIKVYLGVEVNGLQPFADKWENRPLPPDQLTALASLASSLLPLHEAIQHKFLQRLIHASTIYNNYVRDLDFFEFLHEEPRKTLRKELIKVVMRQTQARSSFRIAKMEGEEED